MSVPRVAQLRQMQALNRKKQLEENASRAQSDDRNSMFGRHHQNQRYGYAPSAKFAMTNRPTRDRNAGVITSKEWEESVAQYEDSGRGFRRFFYGLVLLILLLLAFAKYDVEANLELPQIENGRGFGEIVENNDGDGAGADAFGGSGTTGTAKVSDREMEELYNVLGVKGRLQRRTKTTDTPKAQATPTSAEGEAEAQQESATVKSDPDKERRRENYRVRQELKQAYESHQEGIGQLVHCGRACESKNQQVELAYTALASQVDRELYGVLLNAKSTREKRSSSPGDLKAAYEAKRAEILATEENDEDRNMALEEIKDAYEILSNPEAKAYYHLYGMKPPQMMKHASARHGGWGQEIQLGTYKYRLVFSWLDYFGSSWGEIVVLGAIAVFILMRLPQALQQTQRLVDELEWEERMNQPESERKPEGEGDASDN